MRAPCWGRCQGITGSVLANLRLLYTYMFTHPGKKLLFMGCEIAQDREWDHARSVDWDLLELAPHRGVQDLVQDLNALLLSGNRAWTNLISSGRDFEWIGLCRTRISLC